MAEQLRPGQVVGADVIREGARIPLIRTGTSLTPILIERIRALGLEREVLASLSAMPRAAEPSRAQAPRRAPQPRGAAESPALLREAELEILGAALAGNCLPSLFRQVVAGIASRAVGGAYPPDFRMRGVHALRHPLEVLTLSIVIGKGLGYDLDRLVAVACAALLHETRDEDLTSNEGLARLAAMDRVGETLALFKAWRLGTGPLRFDSEGQEPHPAEVLGVADVYDTMLADKPVARRMPPGVAFQAVLGMAGRRLEAQAVRAFSRLVRPYPAGTMVKLTDGRKALVLEASAENPLQPVVAAGQDRLDLSRGRGVQIADIHIMRREERQPSGLPVLVTFDDRGAVWALLVNVSDHGACLEIDGAVESAFRVEIDLCGGGKASLRARGVVCWTRAVENDVTRIGLFVPAGGLRKACRTAATYAS